jgi:hypothetical protein
LATVNVQIKDGQDCSTFSQAQIFSFDNINALNFDNALVYRFS